MSGGEHRTIPFSQLHISKLRSGLSTALVVNGGATAPEGVGDIFLATNNDDLYVSRDGAVWELFSAGGSSYSGTKRQMNTDVTIPGLDTGTYLEWGDIGWDTDDYGTDPVNMNQPALGVYEYSLHIKIGNTAAGRWHIEINNDNSVIGLITEFYADGSSNPMTFSVTGQFYALKAVPDPDAYFYVYLYHDTPTDQDILAYSFLTLQRISGVLA